VSVRYAAPASGLAATQASMQAWSLHGAVQALSSLTPGAALYFAYSLQHWAFAQAVHAESCAFAPHVHSGPHDSKRQLDTA
jgi:hypothetical protein